MLEVLEEIIGRSFRDDLNINHINLEYKDQEKRFRKEGETLHLNLARLSPNEREEFLNQLPAKLESQGRLLREEVEEETQAMEAGYTEDYEGILSYFENILSNRYLNILERSLHLRALIENRHLTKEEIQEKKGQIARAYGADAIHLSSLATAGYFDPNGGIRDILVEMELNPEYSRHNFQSTLEEYVEKKLICVFVENDDEVEEARQEVRGRLARYQREKPVQDWLDVRGIGPRCEAIIDGVLEELEDEFMSLEYDRWNKEGDLWVRIRPRSLPNIT